MPSKPPAKVIDLAVRRAAKKPKARYVRCLTILLADEPEPIASTDATLDQGRISTPVADGANDGE
jgi:hypothetical protein